MPTTVKIHNPPLSDIRRKPHPDKIIQQPTPTIPYNPWDFEYPWSRGLCSCKKQCDEACYALWCYPCFACQLAWRLNESCWITCCVPGSLAILRTKIRTAYRIDGSYIADLCVTECCPCCATLQMTSELKYQQARRPI